MKDRFQILFVPFVISLIGLTIGYTFLNWLVFIKLELFSLKEIIIEFGIPVSITGIITLLVLRPRLKILSLKAKHGSWTDFYSFILWIGLSIPLVISQKYISTSTGKLQDLYSIKDYYTSDNTKYYKFKKIYIDKHRIGIHTSAETSGRFNENFHISIYLTLPIFENANDTIDQVPLGWYGLKYHKQISNRLETEEKNQEYQKFLKNTQKLFNKTNIYNFKYLERIGNTLSKDKYLQAVKNQTIYPPVETIFIGINEPYDKRGDSKLKWLFGSCLIISLVWLLMIRIPELNPKQLKRIKLGKPDRKAIQEKKEIIKFLIPKNDYFITPIVIYLNLLVFILMVIKGFGFFNFHSIDLLNWGANYGPLVKSGQIWRLFTNIFIHGGVLHLLANMYGLLFVGIFIEPLLGRVKFIILYLLNGLLASYASIWWYDATVSIGASGAIFGLYGFFIASMITKVFPKEFSNNLIASTAIFIGFNLLMGLTGNIDNAAHIGGLINGFILGLIYSFILNKKLKSIN